MVEKIKKEKGKVLVTGSSGMLGTDLCRELAGGCGVMGLDIVEKPETRVQKPEFEFVRCDITDKEKTMNFILDTKPDAIIHTAAWTDVDGCEKDPEKAEEINTKGTKNISAAASKSGIPLFYISTDFVFDGKSRKPYTESASPNPINVYGRSKLGGEDAVSALEKYVILRTGWLYGLNGKNFVDTILNTAKTKKDLRVIDDQVGCPTYSRDLAKAVAVLLGVTMPARPNDNGTRGGHSGGDDGRLSADLSADLSAEAKGESTLAKAEAKGESTLAKAEAKHEKHLAKAEAERESHSAKAEGTMDDGRWGIYHISNKGEVSWFEYTKYILTLAGIKGVKVLPIKSGELDRPARRPAYSVLDNGKFEKLTNFSMRKWQDALKEYMDEKKSVEPGKENNR